MQPSKIHYCDFCGQETEDWDELPNGRKAYVCNDPKCAKEFRDTCREIDSERRSRAEEDDFMRYGY